MPFRVEFWSDLIVLKTRGKRQILWAQVDSVMDSVGQRK